MNTDNCLEFSDELLSYFEYKGSSPTGLVWKKWNRAYGSNRRNPGDAAGCRQYMRNGIPHCIRIGFNGKNYQVHRIIWTLLFGKIPSDHIVDHADGNPFNNKLNNLRVIHSHRNTQNAKRRSDNSTGYTGINLLTSKYGTQHYVASWKVMKKTHSKSFNIGILGKEKALELAIAYRKEQLSKLNEQGASYTERHGKDGFPN